MSQSVTTSKYINISPAKKLRSLRRLVRFRRNKMCHSRPIPSLEICPQKNSSFLPTKQKSLSISPQETFSFSPPKLIPNLAVSFQSSMDIPPNLKKMSIQIQSTSIPPRPVYHPAIINACTAMFAKHPSQLQQDEVEKFKRYRHHKTQIGEPLETEIIYLPSGGLRTCLNCRELT